VIFSGASIEKLASFNISDRKGISQLITGLPDTPFGERHPE